VDQVVETAKAMEAGGYSVWMSPIAFRFCSTCELKGFCVQMTRERLG
jgi:hypothetical protein